jgi:hypothetical protein
MVIDVLLLAIIVAGIGLSIVYLRAEYVLHRRFKAAEQKISVVQHELHINRLKHKQIDLPMAAPRNHQLFLGKESAIRMDSAPAESPSAVHSRTSASDAEIARHRELA